MIIGIAKGLVGGAALSSITKAIYGLYGKASSINDFLDAHIDKMKAPAVWHVHFDLFGVARK